MTKAEAIILTAAAWLVGLLLDANLKFQPAGFLMLRVLFPVLAMGWSILKSMDSKGADDK